MSLFRKIPVILVISGILQSTAAEPTVVDTTVLGPFTGADAKLHPDNMTPHRIAYYGTDLGYSYEHEGKIHFLFGDTWATEAYAPIETATGSRNDDGFGSIELKDWPDPGLISSANMPTIKLGQHPDSVEMSAIDPGHAMDLGKTPLAGFSNGTREFGLFLLGKPVGCRTDSQCSNGLSCDTGLGFIGPRYTEEMSFTAGCIDGEPACNAATMENSGSAEIDSGFCSDSSSTIWARTAAGRVSAIGYTVRIGVRNTSDPRKYTRIYDWLTTKFINTTVSTVEDFEPANGPGHVNQNYGIASGSGKNRRVFLWGRPGFVGVAARDRTMGLYFAYANMPVAPDFDFNIHYYTGTDKNGIPRFSHREKDAAAVDLDATTPGIQTREEHDVTDQMSIVWIDHIKKWVMFYGGGMGRLPTATLPNCGVLEAFTRYECKDAVVGNGAFRMRTADHPWGPWTPPQDLIAGGDPDVPGSGQYGPGGVLRHPACTAPDCAPHTRTPYYNREEYGFFYAANIIEQWIKPAGDSVDVFWNASTWDPYRVVLLRTRIKK